LPPGVHKDTQIERYDWNLHDFDLEVQPILNSLVGRCLQQSRIELIEEYEDDEWKAARVTHYKKIVS
jgi:Radial spoke protein 3